MTEKKDIFMVWKIPDDISAKCDIVFTGTHDECLDFMENLTDYDFRGDYRYKIEENK